MGIETSIPTGGSAMRVREVTPTRGVVLVVDIGVDRGARRATELLDAGWSVAVTARTVGEIVRIMPGKPARRFFALVADPSDQRQANRIVDRVTARFGGITRVIDPTAVVASVWSARESLPSVA